MKKISNFEKLVLIFNNSQLSRLLIHTKYQGWSRVAKLFRAPLLLSDFEILCVSILQNILEMKIDFFVYLTWVKSTIVAGKIYILFRY